MTHPALTPGAVAVVTGGASGIGLAAAKRLAAMGLAVCVADLGADRLAAAAEAIGGDVLTVETDVTRIEDLRALEAAARARFGRVDALMLNAGIQPGSGVLTGDWDLILATNLMGVVRGAQVFLPNMLAQATPGIVIVTGSKQGITTPPGDPAYNVAKAGVKAFAEALEHDLRGRDGRAISAHLLIPGFVFTGLTAGDRVEKPAAAWTPEQTVDFMMESLDRGDFYILCPDNDVSRALDERRILWAAGDIVENRPPLSRWHPDHAEAFAEFVKKG